MITCVADYAIDPRKTKVFEKYAERWIELINRYDGPRLTVSFRPI